MPSLKRAWWRRTTVAGLGLLCTVTCGSALLIGDGTTARASTTPTSDPGLLNILPLRSLLPALLPPLPSLLPGLFGNPGSGATPTPVPAPSRTPSPPVAGRPAAPTHTQHLAAAANHMAPAGSGPAALTGSALTAAATPQAAGTGGSSATALSAPLGSQQSAGVPRALGALRASLGYPLVTAMVVALMLSTVSLRSFGRWRARRDISLRLARLRL